MAITPPKTPLVQYPGLVLLEFVPSPQAARLDLRLIKIGQNAFLIDDWMVLDQKAFLSTNKRVWHRSCLLVHQRTSFHPSYSPNQTPSPVAHFALKRREPFPRPLTTHYLAALSGRAALTVVVHNWDLIASDSNRDEQSLLFLVEAQRQTQARKALLLSRYAVRENTLKRYSVALSTACPLRVAYKQSI